MDSFRKLLPRNVHSRHPGALNPSMNLTPSLKYQALAFSELHLWTRCYSERSRRTFSCSPDVSPLEKEEGDEVDKEDGAGEWQGPGSKLELSRVGLEPSSPH